MPELFFEGARYSVLDGESALDALIRGGAAVSFSCRKGSCQACLMRATAGDPGAIARQGLSDAMVELGYFLPCQARPTEDLTLARPDLSKFFVKARVESRLELAPGIVGLRLEPETNIRWRAGQLLNVRGPGGVVRSYSLASVYELDYFLELHIQRIPGGALSDFLTMTLKAGDEIEVQGPSGHLYYETGREDQPLLMVASGTGLAPLWGVLRDALRLGHRGPIALYHGARSLSGLYLDAALRSLAQQHTNFTYVPCVSGELAEEVPGVVRGRAADVAFRALESPAEQRLFVAGKSEMVYAVRARAVAAGIRRGEILADPFESGPPFMPDDAAKLAALPPDPELWEALGRAGLLAILTDFYGRVFADPRLSPFFHGVTQERAIGKQFSFLFDVFTGKKEYFGLRPFNAHHWMIISDELFDYREALFEECLQRFGLAEPLIRRWLALHELFRREIVKSSARGIVLDGVEQKIPGFEELVMSEGAVCDGCRRVLERGAKVRCHLRTGLLYCEACEAVEGGHPLPAAAAPPRRKGLAIHREDLR